MSVSKWKYTPACDGDYCVGDCDLCDKEPGAEEEENTMPSKTKYARVREILYLMKFNTEQISQTVSTELMEKVLNRIEGIDIVRCKECKWFDIEGIHGRPLDGHEVCNCKKFYGYPMRDDEYCSRAERRKSDA